VKPDTPGLRLRVTIEPAGRASVVCLAGELDLSTLPLLEQPLLAETASEGDVIVNLTDVSFIDSSGIGLLIRAFRSLPDAGKFHTVVAEGSQVDRVFELAGIGRALPLFMDLGHAIEALDGTASD
jgi:anti-sigma B factor antagonist